MGINPLDMWHRLRAFPFYIINAHQYSRANENQQFKINLSDLLYQTGDRYGRAGDIGGHYFWQDLWAAQRLYRHNIKSHVDVGSRLDGFIAHVLPFCRVTYIDIRPFSAVVDNLEFKEGSVVDMPFEVGTVASLSSLHVLEHIGLGRYGNRVDPDGHIKAARELTRVLAKGGELLIGTPMGRERLCFDAHRVFDPQTVADLFSGLEMVEFNLIDDKGLKIIHAASFEQARACDYGCGLFVFMKP